MARRQVAVVTGASSGIGRVTAHALAEEGWDVVLAARSGSTLDEVVGECEDRGGRALAVPTDITDDAAVDALVEKAVARFGAIDLFVAAAAVMAFGRFEEIPAEVHHRVIETNLSGTISCARAVLRQFREQGAGTLVVVGSLYGRMTSPFVSPYVTSKYGLMGFTEVLRQELHDAPDISVSLVLPGSIDTPIFRHTANFTGRETRPVPPVSSPDRVARAILRCARRPRRVVVVGNFGRLLSWGHSLFPRLYGRTAPFAMRLGGLRREQADDGEGNVFEPNPRWNQPRGDWRRLPLPVTMAAAALGGLTVWATRWRTGP